MVLAWGTKMVSFGLHLQQRKDFRVFFLLLFTFKVSKTDLTVSKTHLGVWVSTEIDLV